MFLISNKLEQLEFKLEKILGIRNMQEKLENKKLQFCYLQDWWNPVATPFGHWNPTKHQGTTALVNVKDSTVI